MRSIANGNDCTNVTSFSFKVSTDYGVSWTSLTGGRVLGCSLDYSHDSGRWTAELDIANHQYFRDNNLSLDPGHTSSYNTGSVPLLGAYHNVQIDIAKDGTGATMFEGYVGPSDIEGVEDVEMDDVLRCSCVDGMQPWADHWIDKELEGWTLGDVTLSTGTNCLNTILGHYGHAKNIIVEDNPNYYLYHYEMGDTNILDAVSNPVNSIGFVLMWKWNSTNSEFRPTVVDPMRDDTNADADLAGNFRIIRTRYTEANIRTKIRWVYKDRTTGKQASVQCADASAKALYGIPDGNGNRLHKYMRIVEKDLSVIDTRAEAMDACEKALHDVSKPCPGVEIHIPWLCLNIEGGDLIQFTSHSETVKVGVTGIRHRIEPGGPGSTTISGTLDARIGNRRFWLLKGRTDWIGQQDQADRELRGATANAPNKLDAEGLWKEAEDGSTVPILHVRWAGIRDWRTKGYRVKYRQCRLDDSGTADSGTADSLTDSSKSWVPHEFIGDYVQLGGTRGGEDATREIIANTATQLIFEAVSTSVAGSEPYKILKPTTDWQTKNVDQYSFAQLEGLPAGGYVVAQVAVVPKSIDK